MTRAARLTVAVWLTGAAIAVAIIARAAYITDLSAFLPIKPTPAQELLVDQLRDGPASRLILIALEKGDAAVRARLSAAMTQRLRGDEHFLHVDNGDDQTAEQDHAFLFAHRYLLSDRIDARHFTVDGLRAAIEQATSDLASSSGLLWKTLIPHDPTGELLHLVDRLVPAAGPRLEDRAWISADAARTLLVAQTDAAGSDTDAQDAALSAIRHAFQTARATTPGAQMVRLHLSGPGVFAVAARDAIKRAVTRLSLVSGVLVVCILWSVYRSVAALALGLLPVASGALAGIAAVALVFGAVHGTTLGFGTTLIGESVDYAIYFFVSAADSWRRTLWPTIRLGMFTSICGFASLLPSGFPGLAQLGLYSISGLLAAAWVTRYVLPQLLPSGFEVRNISSFGELLERWRDRIRRKREPHLAVAACTIAFAALCILYVHRASLWNHELSALSPISPQTLAYDAMLRDDLGTADVLDLIVVRAASQEAALRGAERAGEALQPLVQSGALAGYDSPAVYLPSLATQTARRGSLPDSATLRARLHAAMTGSALKDDAVEPFVAEVEAARSAPLITAKDLRGTSLAAGFNALTIQRGDRWEALLALHAPHGTGIDVARVRAALAEAGIDEGATVLDMKAQTDALYEGYTSEIKRLSLIGLALIVVLLWVSLRSLRRVIRLLAPLLLAVLVVVAGIASSGQRLTLMHVVGMLLIVAVGSNYALFFDLENSGSPRNSPHRASPRTLTSLLIANLCTVIGFGLLAFSTVPVLESLGVTVAPGTFLALIFAALLTSTMPPASSAPAASRSHTDA